MWLKVWRVCVELGIVVNPDKFECITGLLCCSALRVSFQRMGNQSVAAGSVCEHVAAYHR
jgi:hypothetical protein